MTETTQWEYYALTLGTFMTTPKDQEIEAALDPLGAEGWELVSAFTQHNSNQFRFFLKRPLTAAVRRQRSYPG